MTGKNARHPRRLEFASNVLRRSSNSSDFQSMTARIIHKLRLSYYMTSVAQQWYYRLERNRSVPTWPQFVEFVNTWFSPPARSNPFGELTHLRRVGSVADYQEKFLQLLTRCDNVTEQQQIDIFTTGLRDPLRTDVELHRPPTLEDKMALARAFKRRLELDDIPRSPQPALPIHHAPHRLRRGSRHHQPCPTRRPHQQHRQFQNRARASPAFPRRR